MLTSLHTLPLEEASARLGGPVGGWVDQWEVGWTSGRLGGPVGGWVDQ